MGDESKLFYEKLSRSSSRYYESIRLFKRIINTPVVDASTNVTLLYNLRILYTKIRKILKNDSCCYLRYNLLNIYTVKRTRRK